MATETTASEPGAEELAEAADVVRRFAEVWTKHDPDAIAELVHPEAHLIGPLDRDVHGREQARAFFAGVLGVIPDLEYEVEGWSYGSGQLMIWGRLHGRIAAHTPIEWPVVDRITIRDGLIGKRIAYFDPMVIAAQVLRRPRTWLPFLRWRLAALRRG